VTLILGFCLMGHFDEGMFILVFTGVIVYDYELRIGWGKAVSLPAQALPAPPPGQMAIRAKEGATVSNVAWSGRAAPSPQSVSGQNSEVVSLLMKSSNFQCGLHDLL
jgi:hypothetical protein